MKIKLALIVITVFCFSGVFGQKSGLKIGANFANLYVDDVDDENLKLGVTAGVWHQTADESFQFELLYSNKGAAITYDNIFGSGKYRYNLHYIEMPILFVGHAGPLNLHIGPYAGFLLGVDIKNVDDNGNVDEIAELDRDDFNTFDYGITGGVGIDFSAGQIGARYNYGLREIGKSGTFAGEAVDNAKNSVAQLYIAFNL